MKITTDAIINMLPVTAEVKSTLRAHIQSSDPDEKDKWVDFVWDAYDTLYELVYQRNYQLLMSKLGSPQAPVDVTFAHKVEEKTDKDMEQFTMESMTDAELSQIRAKLQSFSVSTK